MFHLRGSRSNQYGNIFLDDDTSTKFDHRLRSRLSNLLNVSRQNSESETGSVISVLDPEDNVMISWRTMTKISSIIYNSSFQLRYGNICLFSLLMDLLVFGTKKGFAVVFDYAQNMKCVLQSRPALSAGSVTCVAISIDLTYVATGHSSGAVLVYELLSASDPVLCISSLPKLSAEEGHPSGIPITHLFFLNKRHTAVVSADAGGRSFFHDGYRTLLGYHYKTQKIMGPSGKQKSTNPAQSYVFACAPLPLSLKVSPIDSLNLVALITGNALVVISITPEPSTQLKIGRPAVLAGSPAAASLSWYPEFYSNSLQQTVPPRLLYSFGNILTLLELDVDVPEQGNPSVSVGSKKRWACEEPIVSLLWLSSKVALVMTVLARILVVDTGLASSPHNPTGDLRVITSVDAISHHILYNNYMDTSAPLFNSYAHTMRTFRGNLFVLTYNRTVSTGTVASWQSRVSKLEPTAALAACLRFYTGECDLLRYKLPENDAVRHSEVRETLKYLVYSNLPSANEETLSIIFDAVLALRMSPEELEQLYDMIDDGSQREKFLDHIEDLICSNRLHRLSPKVMKELILHYVHDKVEKEDAPISRLEEMICLLDVTDMDLNLVLTLCDRHRLVDARVFIWTRMMKDYVSPLMDFFSFIRRALYGLSTDTMAMEHASKVYTYLIYVLTGRQYPLELLIQESEDSIENIKISLYYVLFSGGPIEWPPNSGEFFLVSENPIAEEPIAFPYLYILLKFDVEQTLLMLNEALEDSFLSEEVHTVSERADVRFAFEEKTFSISRQYVVDVLVQLVRNHDELFDTKNRILLSVFVLRNYPKYPQFIRISDLALDNLIEIVCEVHDLADDPSYKLLKNDCELSLQSLLGLYQPTNLDSELLFYFEQNGFSNLLFGVYQSERNAVKILRLWLKDPYKPLNGVVYLSYQMVRTCFQLLYEDGLIADPMEYNDLLDSIRNNFVKLVEIDLDLLEELIRTFEEFEPSLSQEIYKADEDLQLKYLPIYFQQNNKPLESDVFRYISLLSKKQRDATQAIQKIDLLTYSGQLVEQLVAVSSNCNDIGLSVYLLKDVKKDSARCLDRIIQYVRSVTSQWQDLSEEKSLWKYLGLAIEQCETTTTSFPEDGAELWVRLNHCVSGVIRQAEKNGSDTLVQLGRRLLQEVFVRLMISDFGAHQGKTNDAFLHIVDSILGSDSAATIADVKDIVNEMDLLNSHNVEALKITLLVYNREVQGKLAALEEENDRGVTPKSVECMVCGKKIWGRHVSYKVHQAWEDFQRKRTEYIMSHGVRQNMSLEGFEYDASLWKDLRVVVFKCGHAYHVQCVENLGGDMQCIVCEKEIQ